MKIPRGDQHYLKVAKRAGKDNVEKTGVFKNRANSDDPHKGLRKYAIKQTTLKST